MNLYEEVVNMNELNYKKIGERLRKLRKYMGLTQEQVANILGLGRDAIIRIEKGNRKIDLQELKEAGGMDRSLVHVKIRKRMEC